MKSLEVLYPFQGLQYSRRCLQIRDPDGVPVIGVYGPSSMLTAVVWEGQNQATLFSPTVAWYTAMGTQTGYGQGQFSLQIAGTQTSSLDPAGEYYLLVRQTTGGVTSPVWQARLKVLATPGSTSPSPPGLATYDYVEASLSEQQLADSQRDFIPYLIAAASSAIRRFCFGRNFDMRTYTEEYDLALDGTVRLYQVPVQQILRIATSPVDALLVFNASQDVQSAQVVFRYVGEYDGYGPMAQNVLGLNLNWMSNGVPNTTSVSYVANMTIGQLAAAVNLVGSGWSASAQGTYAAWAATQLIGGYTGMEASQIGDGDGATLQVYGTNLSLPQSALNQRTGLVMCGMAGNDTFDSPRWGPDFGAFAGDWGDTTGGRVLVTYTAGFLSIPPPVQFACAELVKHQLMRLKVNDLIKSENAADYGYTLRDQMIGSMPDNVRQALSPYRLHYA